MWGPCDDAAASASEQAWLHETSWDGKAMGTDQQKKKKETQGTLMTGLVNICHKKTISMHVITLSKVKST